MQANKEDNSFGCGAKIRAQRNAFGASSERWSEQAALDVG